MCWGKVNFWGILDEVHKYSKEILNERETIFFFFMFLGKLLNSHLWRKSVLIFVLIRSLAAFVRPCRSYFTWIAPSALCITVFLQAEFLFHIEVQDFRGPACGIC